MAVRHIGAGSRHASIASKPVGCHDCGEAGGKRHGDADRLFWTVECICCGEWQNHRVDKHHCCWFRAWQCYLLRRYRIGGQHVRAHKVGVRHLDAMSKGRRDRTQLAAVADGWIQARHHVTGRDDGRAAIERSDEGQPSFVGFSERDSARWRRGAIRWHRCCSIRGDRLRAVGVGVRHHAAMPERPDPEWQCTGTSIRRAVSGQLVCCSIERRGRGERAA